MVPRLSGLWFRRHSELNVGAGLGRCIFSILSPEHRCGRARTSVPFYLRGRTNDRMHEVQLGIKYQSRHFSIGVSPSSKENLTGQKVQGPVAIDSVGESETKLMRENASYLLNLPDGSMEPHTWNEAEVTFKWWIAQRSEESLDVLIDLLERFVKEAQADSSAINDLDMFFDKTVMCSLIMNWHDLWKSKDLSWTPFRFLKALDYFHQTVPQIKGLEITGPVISYIINGLRVRSNPSDAADSADELLHYYLDNPGVLRRPELPRYLINIVLNFWSKSGRSDAVERAEITFSRIRKLDLRILDAVAYNTMLDVYNDAGDAEKSETLLLTMSMDWLKDWRLARPDQTSISRTISAWSRSGDSDAFDRVIQLLRRLKEPLHPLGTLGMSLDTAFLNNILDTWVRSGHTYAPTEARKLLNAVSDLGFRSARPDNKSYAIVTEAFANAADPYHAEIIIGELCARYQTEKHQSLSPTPHMFRNLIDAWMRSNEIHKEQKVREILKQMRKLHKGGILCSAPDTFLFNQVLSAIFSTNQTDKAKCADDFLQEMKEAHLNGDMDGSPNDWSYSFVIIGYLETPCGVKRAQELLSEALSDGVAMSLGAAVCLIKALVKAGDVNGADIWMHKIFDAIEDGNIVGDAKPSHSLFHCVLNGWYHAGTSDKNAGFRASKLVQRMYELREKGLLHDLEDLKTLQLLRDICLKNDHEEALDHASEVISMMEEAQESNCGMMPDDSMYANIISGYKMAGMSEKVKMILQRMSDQKERISRDFSYGETLDQPDML